MKLRIIRLLVVIALIAAGGLWYINNPEFIERLWPQPEPPAPGIFASGFIEARDVAIASEVSGRIVYISAKEGDEVKAGAVLSKLDDSLLNAQRRQAELAVSVAKSILEQAVIAQGGARKLWEDALDVQQNPLELEGRIIAAQGEVNAANVDVRFAYHPVDPSGAWQQRTAETRLDTAQKRLDNLLAIKSKPQEINAAVDRADAAYRTASSAVTVAQRQVDQAESPLEVIKVQLSKLTLTSPISGVVAARDREVGEIAQPGAPILTITELEEVTLTAYVAESKIGLVKLGQEAIVSVDSYTSENFTGEVVFISPRALFTPKNIQMKEEREKMVFAVKIRLLNPEFKLKPGMPADAHILAPTEPPPGAS